jgi:hypothetical protein
MGAPRDEIGGDRTDLSAEPMDHEVGSARSLAYRSGPIGAFWSSFGSSPGRWPT